MEYLGMMEEETLENKEKYFTIEEDDEDIVEGINDENRLNDWFSEPQPIKTKQQELEEILENTNLLP
jgi:hypothetical protein